MSRYHPLSPGNAQKTIGICDRCRRKFQLYELTDDGDTAGLLVCKNCSDQLDPYKKSARTTEKITVRRPRPDVPLE